LEFHDWIAVAERAEEKVCDVLRESRIHLRSPKLLQLVLFDSLRVLADELERARHHWNLILVQQRALFR
jgi:hypothetical protein